MLLTWFDYRRLRSPDTTRRLAAAYRLAESTRARPLRSSEAKRIATALQKETDVVAIKVLLRLFAVPCSVDVSHALGKLLENESGEIRFAAFGALERVGAIGSIPTDLNALLRVLLRQRNAEAWTVARDVLRRKATSDVVQIAQAYADALAAIHVTDSTDYSDRMDVVATVANLSMLQTPCVGDRISAVVRAWIAHYKSLKPYHRGSPQTHIAAAVEALGRVRHGSATPLLLELTRLDIDEVRKAAVCALVRLGEVQLLAVSCINGLQARDAWPSELRRLARTLGECGDPSAIPALEDSLLRVSSNVAIDAALDALRELSRSRAATAEMVLARLDGDPSLWSRAVVYALGQLALPSTASALARVGLADPSLTDDVCRAIARTSTVVSGIQLVKATNDRVVVLKELRTVQERLATTAMWTFSDGAYRNADDPESYIGGAGRCINHEWEQLESRSSELQATESTLRQEQIRVLQRIAGDQKEPPEAL